MKIFNHATLIMQIAPEQLEAAREESEKLAAVEITEVDLQWVQVHALLFSCSIEVREMLLNAFSGAR